MPNRLTEAAHALRAIHTDCGADMRGYTRCVNDL